MESNKDSDSVVSAHIAKEHEEVVAAGKEVEKHGHKIIHKKIVSLPRRTSKRLAGIEADACMELKTDNQGSVAATKQKGETKAVVTKNSKNSSNLNKGFERQETGNAGGNEKKQEDATLPMEKLHSDREVGPELNIKDKDEKKSEMSSPVKDMWMDPCIDFAIKTLTGAIPIPVGEETPQSSSLSSSAGNPQSSVELGFGDIWADPCFAFAVKTLTGEIPITDDLCGGKVVEQQCSAAGPQVSNGLAQPSIRQVNLSARHFNVAEKPLYKQQEQGPVAPPAYHNCWLAKFGSNRPSSLC